LLEAGKFVPVIGQRYRFSETSEALYTNRQYNDEPIFGCTRAEFVVLEHIKGFAASNRAQSHNL
jgi:hypothetical protein